MIYVALLRGINVGGNNKISMKELKIAFEKSGMTNVKTYINSGNIIFEDAKNNPQQIVAILEKAIKKTFKLEIKVWLRDIKNIQQVVKALPATWKNDNETKCDVLFLSDEIDSKATIKELPIRSEYDTVKYVKGAILWKIDRKNVTRSGLQKIVGTSIYKQMTIRNCNTVRKLAELMQ